MSGAYMSCKGHNARCVCAWLSSCLNISLQKRVPPMRLVGSWLETEVLMNHTEWPEHDMLAPSAVCMNLGSISFWWQVYELAGLYPCAHVCRHWILRDALNRLFCGMERSGRYLWHGSDVTKTSASTLCDLVRSRCESSCLLLRSREAAEDIYQHGMRFLRVHKLLTSLAQRSGCRDSVDYADLEIPCTDLAGTI